MITAQVIEIVTTILTSHHLFRAEPVVTPDSSLAELGADDIDRTGIALGIEARWHFIVSDQDEREWTHVSDIVTMVEERIEREVA